MGKQVRRTFKPRPNPLGQTREETTVPGNIEQVTLAPDQVLPVIQKVLFFKKKNFKSCQKILNFFFFYV